MARGIHDKQDYWWEPVPLKNGKPGKRLRLTFGGLYTPLFTCEVCGHRSVPAKVTYRGDCWGWEFSFKGRFRNFIGHSRCMLCTGCWNRVRPIARAGEALNEARLAIVRLDKVIADVKKIRKNDGGRARVIV